MNNQLYLYGYLQDPLDTNTRGIVIWDGSKWKAPFPGKWKGITNLAWFNNQIFMIENHPNSIAGEAGADTLHVIRWNGAAMDTLTMDHPVSMIGGMVADSQNLYIVGTDKFQRSQYQLGLRILKWDGKKFVSVDAEEFIGHIYDVKLSPSGLIIGGEFQGVGNLRADNLARWDGSKWHAFSSGANPGPGNLATALYSSGSKLYFGGPDLIFAGNAQTRSLTAWDGSSWTNFPAVWKRPKPDPELPLIYQYPAGEINAITEFNNQVYIGGTFDSASNTAVRNIAHWDGKAWAPMGSGCPTTVSAMLADGSDLIVGMNLWRVEDSTALIESPFNGSSVVRWNGQVWQPLPGIPHDGSNQNNVLQLFHFQNQLWALIEGTSTSKLFRWNGSTWDSPLIANEIEAATVYQNTLYYVDDSLYFWNGSGTPKTVPGICVQPGTDGIALTSDGDNLFLETDLLPMPGCGNCTMVRWDGKSVFPMLTGRELNWHPKLIVFGDYLYMEEEWPKAFDNVPVNYYARWNRKSGSWSVPEHKGSSSKETRNMKLFDIDGGRHGWAFDPQSTVFGMDGKHLAPKSFSAGVKIIVDRKK